VKKFVKVSTLTAI